MTDTRAPETIGPLAWPAEWLHATDLQKALIGMPFIGIQDRVHQNICRQLAARGPDYRTAWSSHPVPEEAWCHCSRRITEEGLWPSERSIPDDPFAIVFWDHRLDGLVVEDLLAELAARFGLDRRGIAWESYREATYGGVLASLAQGAVEQPGAPDKVRR